MSVCSSDRPSIRMIQLHCWNPLLGNSGIQQFPLFEPIIAKKWDIGSH
jgi:hypothetical protein